MNDEKNTVIYLLQIFRYPLQKFVNILKESHETSNKDLHSNYYKTFNSYKVKESLKSSRLKFIKRCV